MSKKVKAQADNLDSPSRKQVKKLMKLPKIALAELVQNYEECFREASQKHLSSVLLLFAFQAWHISGLSQCLCDQVCSILL